MEEWSNDSDVLSVFFFQLCLNVTLKIQKISFWLFQRHLLVSTPNYSQRNYMPTVLIFQRYVSTRILVEKKTKNKNWKHLQHLDGNYIWSPTGFNIRTSFNETFVVCFSKIRCFSKNNFHKTNASVERCSEEYV